MILEDIREQLRRPEERTAEIALALGAALAEHKVNAVTDKNQELAKEIWCLETTLEIQSNFLTAFSEMRQELYYEAWCTLEQAEIGVLSLRRHRKLSDFCLSFIAAHVERFQGLFPYKLFFSPGFVVKERRCGLCNALITPRMGCDHRLGEIYDGVLCFHEIADAEIAEVSMVSNPVQKSCIGWVMDSSGNRIEYDHSIVRYVVERLQSPFHAWGFEWTKIRHPHSLFQGTAPSAPCPCESQRNYADCCLPEAGVMRPHCAVFFAVPPPEAPSIKYVY